MKIITFKVKEGSIIAFFKAHVKGREHIEEKDDYERHTSAYHLMQDEILIRDFPQLDNEGCVQFELTDTGQISKAKIIHLYTYIIERYDDVHTRLVLEGFKVSVEPEVK